MSPEDSTSGTAKGDDDAIGIKSLSYNVTVAAVQLVSTFDVQQNLATAEPLVALAAERGAKLVVLPENFALMGRHGRDKCAIAESEGGPLQRWCSQLAIRYHLWLVAGTLPFATTPASAKVYNRLMIFDEAGRVQKYYDKMHLFGFNRSEEQYDEGATVEAGRTVETLDNTPAGRLGLSICYDLRFPELFRAMGVVDALVVPAAFLYTTGIAHWETLLRARAIENQCYVIAAAQGGCHSNGQRTFGHSLIIDPWGTILDILPSGEGIVLATLEAARLQQVRTQLPALKHRKLF